MTPMPSMPNILSSSKTGPKDAQSFNFSKIDQIYKTKKIKRLPLAI